MPVPDATMSRVQQLIAELRAVERHGVPLAVVARREWEAGRLRFESARTARLEAAVAEHEGPAEQLQMEAP